MNPPTILTIAGMLLLTLAWLTCLIVGLDTAINLNKAAKNPNPKDGQLNIITEPAGPLSWAITTGGLLILTVLATGALQYTLLTLAVAAIITELAVWTILIPATHAKYLSTKTAVWG